MLYVNVTATCFLQAQIHVRSDCRELTTDDSIIQTQILVDRQMTHAFATGLDRASTMLAVRDFFLAAAGSSCSRSYGGAALDDWRLDFDGMDDAALSRRGDLIAHEGGPSA